jgi:hypothetical protein
MKRWFAILALAILPGAAQALEPCKVLTEADVRAALGGEWKTWTDLSGEDVCAFQGSPSAIVSLTLASDPMGAARILEARRTLAGDKVKPADGPGDGAYRLAMPAANVIVFGKGDTVVQLEVSYAASKDTAVVDRLAKTAYERLP